MVLMDRKEEGDRGKEWRGRSWGRRLGVWRKRMRKGEERALE